MNDKELKKEIEALSKKIRLIEIFNLIIGISLLLHVVGDIFVKLGFQ